MIPFITCEVSLCQYVCELAFGVNVFDLDFWVQIDSIEQPIKSNSVGSGNMSQGRAASLSSNTYNKACCNIVLIINRDTRHELKHGLVECRSSNTRQLGCVFQDMEPPKSSSILRKSSGMQKPIQRVKFTKAIARHTKIRDQNPSLGMICTSGPHQRSPNAPKFEDRSQEETEWQEQGAREAAWKLAKNVF